MGMTSANGSGGRRREVGGAEDRRGGKAAFPGVGAGEKVGKGGEGREAGGEERVVGWGGGHARSSGPCWGVVGRMRSHGDGGVNGAGAHDRETARAGGRCASKSGVWSGGCNSRGGLTDRRTGLLLDLPAGPFGGERTPDR
jgi:hypothetical protein